MIAGRSRILKKYEDLLEEIARMGVTGDLRLDGPSVPQPGSAPPPAYRSAPPTYTGRTSLPASLDDIGPVVDIDSMDLEFAPSFPKTGELFPSEPGESATEDVDPLAEIEAEAQAFTDSPPSPLETHLLRASSSNMVKMCDEVVFHLDGLKSVMLRFRASLIPAKDSN